MAVLRCLPRPMTPTLLSKLLLANSHVSDVSPIGDQFLSISHILISPVVPANCSTPFWDPIKGDCICNSSTCAFQDTSKPIGVSHYCK